MRIKKMHMAILVLLFVGAVLLNACRTIRNFTNPPKPWAGECRISPGLPEHDASKPNVFIIADAKMTELFDMLAPFYLFNSTGQANVYIIAKDHTPVLVKRNLFILPQLTFRQADSLKWKAGVIVIPALSARDENQDTAVVGWIKRNFGTKTKMLAVCDGASTAAATGLYDGREITCHASDLQSLQPHFNRPVWIKNISVARSGNLYSTAGVSNAVDGSLAVMAELFEPETVQRVMEAIHYPHPEIKLAHESIVLKGRNKLTAAMKVFFRKNRNIGVLLQNGVNELELAGIIDTYSRSLPASFKTYVPGDSTFKTRYGLSLIYTGDNSIKGLDELHVITPRSFSESDALYFKNVKITRYENSQKQYLLDNYIQHIADQYGKHFADFVKISLDYN